MEKVIFERVSASGKRLGLAEGFLGGPSQRMHLFAVKPSGA
jgi:hypothetical protein